MEERLGSNYEFKVDLKYFVEEAEDIHKLVFIYISKILTYLLKMKLTNTSTFYRRNKELMLKLRVLRKITAGHFDHTDLRAKWIKTLQSVHHLQ